MLVVLDPGHGGPEDRGAQYHNHDEADLNLALALYARNRLVGQGEGYSVGVTRSQDIPLALEHRGEVARTMGADLAIIIHHNAGRAGLRGGLAFSWPRDHQGHAMGCAILRAYPVPLLRYGDSCRGATDQDGPEDDWLQRPRSCLESYQGIPTVLLEVGYLSDPDDFRAIMDSAIQAGVVTAIQAGIDRFRALA